MAKGTTSGITPPPPNLFDALGVLPTDDADEVRRLSLYLPVIEDFERFQRELRTACRLLEFGIYEHQRVHPALVTASLRSLESKIASVRSELTALGHDASRELDRQAAGYRSPYEPAEDNRPVGEGSSANERRNDGAWAWQWLDSHGGGRERVAWVKRILADCEAWASAAADATSPPPHRPPDQLGTQIINSLIKI